MGYIDNSIVAKLINFLDEFYSKQTSKYLAVPCEYLGELHKSIESLKYEFLLQDIPYKNIKRDFYGIFASKENTKKNVALVFGAGVSMGKPLNMCNWSGLLKNAVTGHFLSGYEETFIAADDFADRYEKFLGDFDLYELAQYIENSVRERHATDHTYSRDEAEERVNADMYEIVKRSIYKDKDPDGNSSKNKDFDDELKKSILYRMCDYICNKNISRILTYNYDNAFEFTYNKYVKEKTQHYDTAKNLMPVFIDDQLPDADEGENRICYHVHGFVPHFDEKYSQDSKIEKALKKKEAKRLILSEYSYDDMAHSSYKWRNTLQIDTFLKYNCLFFGFSATDKNFKRIVKLMGWRNEGSVFDEEHEAKHYIFMTIDDYIKSIFQELFFLFVDKIEYESECEREKAVKDAAAAQKTLENDINTNSIDWIKKLIVKCRFMYYTLRSRRKYLKGLNIYPIWCTTYDVVDCFDYMLSGK